MARPQLDRPLAPPAAVTNLTGPERALEQRLAAVDRMRDRALDSGDLGALDRADRLERMAREQYAHMIAQRNRVPEATVRGDLPPDGTPRPDDANGSFRAPRGHEDGHESPADPHHPFGQAVAEQATTYGRQFGQFTAEQARQGGRMFGQTNAEKTRPLMPTADGPTGGSLPPAGESTGPVISPSTDPH